jgi:hypothetical protein
MQRRALIKNRKLHLTPMTSVKQGLVFAAKYWPYSSFHLFVKRKIYEINWGESDNMQLEKVGK